MTKSEAYDLGEEFNTATQAAYYTTEPVADMNMHLTNLGTEWTTEHGEEVVAEMSKIFSSMEDAMNQMEAAMAAAKNCYVTIGFHSETTSTFVPNESSSDGGGGASR